MQAAIIGRRQICVAYSSAISFYRGTSISFLVRPAGGVFLLVSGVGVIGIRRIMPVHTENPIRLLDACTYKISP
jgi:hypothetical protein